jgi:cytochrome b561
MVNGFSRVQIGLHWAVALLLFYNLLMGEDMSHVWEQLEDGGTAVTTTGAWAHIIVGILVLALVAWRLVLRMTRGVPPAPTGENALLQRAGAAGHLGLYLLMIAIPVTGLLAWYAGFGELAEIHGEILKLLLWLFIAGHVVAAVFHHFILKDGLLNRMRKPLD